MNYAYCSSVDTKIYIPACCNLCIYVTKNAVSNFSNLLLCERSLSSLVKEQDLQWPYAKFYIEKEKNY